MSEDSKQGSSAEIPNGEYTSGGCPFHICSCDLIEQIEPANEARHRCILTLVDYATRFPEAVPLKRIDTKTVAEALVDIYSCLSVPEEILSDQRTQFISDCMKEVCRLLGVTRSTTTPYHPMCNSLVEKFNGTLKKMLNLGCAMRSQSSGTDTSTLYSLHIGKCLRIQPILPCRSLCIVRL